MKFGLVIYGSLETLSGGYLYDRMLVEHLRREGDTVQIVSMSWQNYARRLGQSFDQRWANELESLDVDVLLEDELNHPSLFRINRTMKRHVEYPIVSIVHHLRSSEEHPRLLLELYRRVERSYLNTIDAFIWNSQTTRQAVERMLGTTLKGVVAYPAGDRFGGQAEAEIMQRSAQSGPLKLLFVGNLIPRKGLHWLIAALCELKEYAWTLTVAGDAQVDRAYAARVRRQVEEAGLGERVHFVGRLSEEGLAETWRDSQVCVMPSSYEGFGIVYLEGMGFGLPAIASTAGGAREIIEDGVNGFLVDAGDTAGMARAIRQYLESPQMLADHSLAARRRFADFPTWEQTAGKIREFLTRL